MRARTATIGDLEAVFGGLSLRLADDFEASGLGTQDVRDALVMCLKEGRAHALADGEKVSALIAWHVSDEIVHTLFAARESFFTALTVRFCRKHIRHIQTLEGNLPVQHRSWLRRPDAVKWFRIIGFIEKAADPDSRLFELPPAPSPREAI